MVNSYERLKFWTLSISIFLICFGILFKACSFPSIDDSADLNEIPDFIILQENSLIFLSNPANPPPKVAKTLPVIITAYSSTSPRCKHQAWQVHVQLPRMHSYAQRWGARCCNEYYPHKRYPDANVRAAGGITRGLISTSAINLIRHQNKRVYAVVFNSCHVVPEMCPRK